MRAAYAWSVATRASALVCEMDRRMSAPVALVIVPVRSQRSRNGRERLVVPGRVEPVPVVLELVPNQLTHPGRQERHT